jgi:hypothetical protein
MKAKLNIYLPILLVSSLILASCSSQNEIATNYYADGIYFDPDYRNVTKTVTNEQPDSQAMAEESFDYYEPGTYNSPYEQQLPGSGWSGGGSFGSMYSPMGWGSYMNMGMGYSWGNSYYPYGDMYPYGGMYSGYYNPFGYNPYMYNPYIFNPYCGYGGFYGGGGFYNPFNPFGYPGYGYYPDNGAGNGFHDYYSGNQPDILIRGGSNPRPTRNSGGNTSRGGGSGNDNKGRREVQTPTSTTTANVTASERLGQRQKTTTTSASRLRSQVTQQRSRTFANETNAPKTDARSAGEARQLYEKTTRTQQPNRNQSSTRATSTRTQTQNTASDNAGNSSMRNSNLARQTQRVINNTSSGQTPSRTYTPQTRTRTYTPRSTNENQSTPSRMNSTRSSSPSSGGSSGGGRSSSGGSSGGGGRTSGGSGGSPTIRR